MHRLFVITLSLVLGACAASRAPLPVQPHPLAANDNRTPAGSLRDGALRLALEIDEGDWQAEAALPAWRLLAFAEAGKPATTPGPLIRVVAGTRVDVSVRNRSADDVTLHGLHARPGDDVPLLVPAHGQVHARFSADAPGTYFYWGTLGKPLDDRYGRDSELNGAFVVDAPGAVADDRIFVITRHGAQDEGGDGVGAWAINGRSWPQTERLDYRVGETVNWRLINASESRHPMHLHGAYFRMTARSDNRRAQPIEASRQAGEVTHSIPAGETADLTWSPLRPGNWLFHCHLLFHVLPENRIPLPLWYDEYADLPHDQHMAGLVLGIHVRADGAHANRDTARAPRHVDLRVGERAGADLDAYFGRHVPGVGYGVDGAAISSPGAPIVLERGRAVEVAIVNELTHATSVHWHGIELESFYDGVPHWGTDGRQVTPAIAPGGSFVARFTPPRAGTFIYHTHFNDYPQLTGGLYGALIVLDAGTTLDAARDHVYVVGQGPDEMKNPLLVNGSAEPQATQWQAGTQHRLRIVGITAISTISVRLFEGETLANWRPLAKDGADLPPARTSAMPAEVSVAPGETYDFVYDAAQLQRLRLVAGIDRDGFIATQSAIDVVR
jgi:FtsP/CotA-like multicopper oxidase with cupredoxin domain